MRPEGYWNDSESRIDNGRLPGHAAAAHLGDPGAGPDRSCHWIRHLLSPRRQIHLDRHCLGGGPEGLREDRDPHHD